MGGKEGGIRIKQHKVEVGRHMDRDKERKRRWRRRERSNKERSNKMMSTGVEDGKIKHLLFPNVAWVQNGGFENVNILVTHTDLVDDVILREELFMYLLV